MDLILATSDGRDIEIVTYDTDIEVGMENSFEIGIPTPAWDGSYKKNMLVYIPGTEYGGIIGEIQTMTNPEYVYVKGRTWRGLLEKKIISPAAGQDYYTISGEANTCIRTLLSAFYKDGLMVGSSEDSGATISNFQFARYTTLLSGIKAMLATVGYRLDIDYIQSGTSGYVELKAVPIINYAAQIELSEDDELAINADEIVNGVNHLICLGEGELSARTIVHIYTDEKGNVVNTQKLKGRYEIAEVYDYPGAESATELRAYGISRLEEIKNRTIFDVEIINIAATLSIGDIVSGREFTTGINVEKPIGSKIFKITGEIESEEYRLEE